MSEQKTLILDKEGIQQKTTRIAYEILENNYDEKELIVIGIQLNGFVFANKLFERLKEIGEIPVSLHAIEIDKDNPVATKPKYDFNLSDISMKVVILVDDVGNTGRTLGYALRLLLMSSPKKIQIAVLVDRKHKSFPICADYVGLSLSTTLKEHVSVELSDNPAAYLL